LRDSIAEEGKVDVVLPLYMLYSSESAPFSSSAAFSYLLGLISRKAMSHPSCLQFLNYSGIVV
jgi:hypothetical protein